MPFNYSHSYYGYVVATQIRGTIGKKYTFQRIHNIQIKYPYYKPADPKTPAQLNQRNKIRLAVLAWQTLIEEQKNFYRKKEPIRPIMSGYNFFIREYILAL
jgi:hypothetical protein